MKGRLKTTKMGTCILCGKPYQETRYYNSDTEAMLFLKRPAEHRKCRTRKDKEDFFKEVAKP